jgi:NAD(P)H-quinone oxidoreductase subunit 5
LERLLCFYEDRPFARLAAHKKFLADRAADCFLAAAAWLAMIAVGSGSISDLVEVAQARSGDPYLQWCGIFLALGVAIRTAMLPVHGWLIQVMEAPTPVSALLHAGVVNLGGYVLIRFAPLFEVAHAARALLVLIGLLTAVLAGFAMLTRVSIKVRLAWSTVAQMGFMVMECGLGLYECAALHLIGHSLYKAQAFLSSGETVRRARLADLRRSWRISVLSAVMAPVISGCIVLVLARLCLGSLTLGVPDWWLGIISCAWAPLLWIPVAADKRTTCSHLMTGIGMVALLTGLFVVGHSLPLGTFSFPHTIAGQGALVAMLSVYVCTVLLQLPGSSRWLEPLRRRSYAGFYLDEAYTRLVLRLWPIQLPMQKEGQHSIKLAPCVP